MATARVPEYAALADDTAAEICVIGAGIAGLTTAYLLLKEGRSVAVIDAFGVGAGETGRTTAHFMPPDERYFAIEKRFGVQSAALVADSYREATDRVEAIVRQEHIDCGFVRLEGYLFSPGARWDDTLDKEFAIATRIGLPVTRAEQVPGMALASGPAIRFDGCAQFHPLRYLAGLAAAIEGMGGRIYGGTRATDIHGDQGRHVVITAQGSIHAQSVVVATNTPFNDRVVMHTKQAGYSTYVVGLRVPKGAIPQVLMWDTGDPYYYVRLTAGERPDHDILVVGGQDHKTGQDGHPQHRHDAIEAWARARFPQAGEVAYRWSGEVMEPADGLPYLGHNPLDSQGVYVITGDSGNGMTHCTAGAILVTDLIQGRSNKWADLYAPSRKAFRGMGEFLTEQANTLSQYADWVRGGDVESVAEIAAGEGALVRDDGKLVAVYRARDGGLQAVSAACTHMGCAVHWNSAEKSWDCPCHGSRFSPSGEVLHGPAPRSLAPFNLSDDGEAPRARASGEERRP
jgi:glycine/D-amino acid oxidase-like deaminating enzyme